DATDAYKAFNHEHWSRDVYEQKYLWWAYGATDDDSITAREISHHLPDERTQQYYEMTGKYNQFAWGWDDARRSGLDIDQFFQDSVLINGGTSGRILDEATTPRSANRLQYETMRDDANKKYDKGRTMTYLAILNHVVSGFEAFFSAKKHNREQGGSSVFSDIDVDLSLKSYHSRRDTPYVKLSYKF
ncbi:MAG: hypothetical protein AB1772_03835, partial [Candidatus Zixiibacteriota bacterium]